MLLSETAEAVEKTTMHSRLINYIKGKVPGPKLIFFAGIHGNEPAGVEALKNTLKLIDPNQIRGEVYGVYGNLKALALKRRFIDKDLNRIWTTENLTKLAIKTRLTAEEEEQEALYEFIKSLLNENSNQPLYFIDFHTTSSPTLPFITINDALINRYFSKCFPVPVVLGIEEYLEGPLLSYLNKEGYVSIGFESGQHNDPSSIYNCESFIYLALCASGVMDKKKILDFEKHFTQLRNQARGVRDVFEVRYKYHITPDEDFNMNPGFVSFQKINEGDELAISDNKIINSPITARLFMPLYQKEGEDGFFIISPIPEFFLRLSSWLRRIKADQLLTFLPGIKWHDKNKGVLRANLRITRFLAKSVFHLFGYRNKQLDETHLLLYNRERVSKTYLYEDKDWFKAKKAP